MSEFIRVEIAAGVQLPPAVVEICPVGIFALREAQVAVVAEREDECTLCELCFGAAPAGSLRIHKLYSGETLTGRAGV